MGAAANGGRMLVSIANNGMELVAAANGGKVLVSIANNGFNARRICNNQPSARIAINNGVVGLDLGIDETISMFGGGNEFRWWHFILPFESQVQSGVAYIFLEDEFFFYCIT